MWLWMLRPVVAGGRSDAPQMQPWQWMRLWLWLWLWLLPTMVAPRDAMHRAMLGIYGPFIGKRGFENLAPHPTIQARIFKTAPTVPPYPTWSPRTHVHLLTDTPLTSCREHCLFFRRFQSTLTFNYPLPLWLSIISCKLHIYPLIIFRIDIYVRHP